MLSLSGCSSDKLAGTTTSADPATKNRAADATVPNANQPPNSTDTNTGNGSTTTKLTTTDTKTTVTETLTITKTLGVTQTEDKTIVVTVTKIDQSGNAGEPHILTFDAGSGGSQEIPGLCNSDGTPTNIQVALNAPGVKNGPTISGSTVSYDPVTCVLTEQKYGIKTDTFNFTCPTSQVIVNGQPASAPQSTDPSLTSLMQPQTN